MSSMREHLKRLGRLAQVRQTYVSVAEAGVKESESQLHSLRQRDDEVVGNIQATRAEIAYRPSLTGHDAQHGERYIKALENQRRMVRQSLERAQLKLEQKRLEWVEARREHKVVQKVQERRLLECNRKDDVEQQKAMDEVSIGRFIRSQPKR